MLARKKFRNLNNAVGGVSLLAALIARASLNLPFNDLGAGAVNTTATNGQVGAFTRATGATTYSVTGTLLTVGSGVARSWYDPSTRVYRYYLCEPASTNLVLQAENFGTTWATIGTPTRTPAALTCGVLSLDLLNDPDAGTLDGYSQTITFTADAVKAVSVFFAQGTSTSSVIQLTDTTATADRLLATITWSGATPVITMTTGTNLGVDGPLANNVYRVRLATTAITAANTNSIRVYPATTAALAVANVGNAYFGGVQSENALVPTTYIPTTTVTVTRNQDQLLYPTAGYVNGATGSAYAAVLSMGYAGTPRMVALSDAADRPALFASGGGTVIGIFDGTTIVNGPALSTVGTLGKYGSGWAGANMKTFSAGVAGVAGAFDGNMDVGTNMGIGFAPTSPGFNINGGIGPVYIFNSQLTDAQQALLAAS